MNEFIIFNSKSSKKFFIGSMVSDLLFELCGDQSTVFVNENYFICTSDQLKNDSLAGLSTSVIYSIMAGDFQIASDILLENQNIKVAKIIKRSEVGDLFIKNIEKKFINFKKGILQMQISWLKIFLECIYDHLKERKSGGKMLINHGIVQITLGDAIERIAAIQWYFDQLKQP